MINIRNIDDNECFKWSIVRYLNPADHNPKGITEADKVLPKLHFKNKKFPVNIHKIEKQNSIEASVFGYENKEKHPIYLSKKCFEEKYADSLLIGEEEKRHYILIKDFNTFMYDHTLYRGVKQFCLCCLRTFSTAEIIKSHINDCFKINGKQRLIMPTNDEFVKFENYERKIKLPFIIYADLKVF